MTGSSPRVRGTLDAVGSELCGRGIIPACAGNTMSFGTHGAGSRDHPRVCGEHCLPIHLMWSWSGSSPRVRGTHPINLSKTDRVGIIPACAGSTKDSTRQGAFSWDHPRVCGEHFLKLCGTLALTGSSPRVRGTPAPAEANLFDPGIIPACAGNTLIPRRAGLFFWDHPRVCGEHPRGSTSAASTSGSSPRVRGTRSVWRRRVLEVGIIPACAGNTHLRHVEAEKRRDHPRVCGEHLG